MKKTFWFLLLTVFLSCTDRDKIVDKNTLLGRDYRLFQNTPAWDLAKAVWDEDLVEITRLVREKKVNLNYQEPRFGMPLLMLTVLNEQYKSCEKLLELGADPNQHDTYDGSSAIIEAASINGTVSDNTDFLKLLLQYKANPNDVEIGKRRSDNLGRATPLLKACSSGNKIVSPLAKVKVLVDAGADINYYGEFEKSPLSAALLADNYDVVVYLLHKNVNYKRPIFIRDNKALYIQDVLRENVFPLESKEFKYKLEIIACLSKVGIDYRSIPVPAFVVEKIKKMYPDNWKDYLAKY